MVDFTAIPSIEQLRQRPSVRALEAAYGGDATVEALRHAAADVRRALAAGDGTLTSAAAVISRIEAAAQTHLDQLFRPSLGPVINATGVVIHTNLGRAPLAAAALERVTEVARGYSSLEYDLARGTRGRRDVHAAALLCRLTGADAAAVVNNNAAATLLMLTAIARGREVIVSRGELVEIGGGFRVPDVMAQSGAVLREVGTTNKTRAADYAAAITDRTALILRVHPSNFRIEGFTERPSVADLVRIGRQFNIPVAEDLGSGNLGRSPADHDADPSVGETIASGVDLCCFSGDKLLGGPQAGVIVGRTALVDALRRHPLMRALRVDKMTYAALEATLVEYAAGRAASTIPVQRMLAMPVAAIRERASALADALNGQRAWRAQVVDGASAIGGGSAPGVEPATALVALAKEGLTADALERQLRALTPPVIARIENDRVVIDLRTVAGELDGLLLRALASMP